jgi:hypothetical protein
VHRARREPAFVLHDASLIAPADVCARGRARFPSTAIRVGPSDDGLEKGNPRVRKLLLLVVVVVVVVVVSALLLAPSTALAAGPAVRVDDPTT